MINTQDPSRAKEAAPRARRAWGLILALALAMALLAQSALAAGGKWPRPEGPVADYARVIPVADAQRITQTATELWQKTKVAVVVATLPSLDGGSLEETAVDLYRAWGIGDKAASKGALILVAVGERRVRIEVGYGFESTLTDLMAGRIRDQVLVPRLKEGDYGQALSLGVAAIANLAAAEAGVTLTGVPEVKLQTGSRRGGGASWGGLGVFLVIIFIYLFLKAGRGGRGGGNFWTGVILGLLMSGGGRSSGGGGGGGGFDSFGGGFGGFGGGMSGGGGASGDF